MKSEGELKAWQFERLKYAVQALAAPPETQLCLLPDFVVKTDELALVFDNFAQAVLGNYREELRKPQVARIEDLARHFDNAEPAVWSDEALKRHPFWAKSRILAVDVLNAFGWPHEDPPTGLDVYIPSSRSR